MFAHFRPGEGLNLLIYEDLTSGGYQSTYPHDPIPDSLLIEGRAMLAALAEDVARIPTVRATAIVLPEHQDVLPQGVRAIVVEQHPHRNGVDCLVEMTNEFDQTLLIAPETGGRLRNLTTWVIEAEGRLLGATPREIAIFGDKRRTAEFWSAEPDLSEVIRATQAVSLEDVRSGRHAGPIVIKPRDGCGAVETWRFDSPEKIPDLDERHWRIEPFYPGTPASIAFLGGGERLVPLLAGEQLVSCEDGRFVYQGGRFPLPDRLRKRARWIGQRLADALVIWPAGYFGIDLILGDAEDGSEDVLLEVNPRLTTSFVGLRHMFRRCRYGRSLTEVLLSTCDAEAFVVKWHDKRIRFWPDGRWIEEKR
jgi:predicted ATP-grasp superfamily ATP-dependent carboligase